MEKKILIMVLAAFLLIIFGCATGPYIEDVDIHVGTEGLVFDFLAKAPPAETYEGGTFKAVLDLKNLGVDDIEDGLVTFGVEKAYISMEGEPFEALNIEGKESNRAGGRELVEKTIFVRSLDPQIETLTTTITATACYPYRTTASPLVCIDTDLYSLREQDKSCIPEEVSLAGGQGGPIAVTSVVPKMVPSKENPDIIKPQFQIFVENAGAGQPVNPLKYVDACTGESLSTEDWNTVNVKAKLITGVGTEYLDCMPKRRGQVGSEGYLKLKEGKNFVRCTFDRGITQAMGTYTTPLIIELDYGYIQSASRTILIRKEIR